jgi:HK97 family phage major capsid protein
MFENPRKFSRRASGQLAEEHSLNEADMQFCEHLSAQVCVHTDRLAAGIARAIGGERFATSADVERETLLSYSSSASDFRELLTDANRKHMGAYTQLAANRPRGSALSNPTNFAVCESWFKLATLGQSSRNRLQFDSEHFDKLDRALNDPITKAAYAEGGATTGQTLVPTIVENDLIRQIKDASKLFKLGRQILMTSLTHDIPSESTSITVGWTTEAGTLTGGEGTLSKKTLTALKVFGRATMSIEMVEDSSPGLLQYLLEVMSEKIGGQLDVQALCGDGAAPAITGIDSTSGINVISSSATAAGRNLTWQLLVNTYVGNGEGTAIENGVWIVSPTGYRVMLGMTDTTGQPMIKYDGPATAPAGTLLGRPIIVSARFGGSPTAAIVTATLDDSTNANTKIIYGVPSSLLCGTRMGLRWDVTDQVSWGSFSLDARLVGRFASVVGVPSNFSRLSKVNYT